MSEIQRGELDPDVTQPLDCIHNVRLVEQVRENIRRKVLRRIENRRNLKKAGVAVLAAIALYTPIRQIASDQMHSNQNAALQAELQQEQKTRKKLEERTERLGRLLGQMHSANGEFINAKGLRPVHELPGYDQHASDETLNTVAASSVSIIQRQKAAGNTSDWEIGCSGNIVDVNGQRVVETSGACFPDRERLKPLPELQVKPLDIAPIATFEYAIIKNADASMPSKYEPNVVPLGYVNNISVTTNQYTALLGVNTFGRPVVPDGNSKLFETLPALKHQSMREPDVGQQMAIAPRLNAYQNGMVQSTGRFLGMKQTDPTSEEKTDTARGYLVGVHSEPSASIYDRCAPGSHGALGVFADGTVSGPMYMRNNISDDSDRDGALRGRLDMEKYLGVETSIFEAICGFGVTTQRDAEALVEAFGQVPPPALVAPPK